MLERNDKLLATENAWSVDLKRLSTYANPRALKRSSSEYIDEREEDTHIYKSSLHHLLGSVAVIFNEVKGASPLVRLIESYPLAINQSICFKNMAEPFSYSDRRADMGDKASISGL